MKEYRVEAEAVATTEIYVNAVDEEDALYKAEQEMKWLFEEQWSLSKRKILGYTLEEVNDDE
jgi:hypothetical protein